MRSLRRQEICVVIAITAAVLTADLSDLVGLDASITAPGSGSPNGRVSLRIGSQAPNFRLPGVNGRAYTLDDFRGSRALAVIFTSVHCPIAQLYEARIQRLVFEYAPRGVAFVVIQPNNAERVPLEDMGYTDVGDSLAGMKIRASHRGFRFPFLYDGDKQTASRKYGPLLTPHLFLFDEQRLLRYRGAIDNDPVEAQTEVSYARDAIDALLTSRPVPVQQTDPTGCEITWIDNQVAPRAESPAPDEPLRLEKATPAEMRALRLNATGRTRLVNFWATWCAPCRTEFPELVKTWRMYRQRPFDLVTVSVNYPDEEKTVRAFLEAHQARSRNLLNALINPYLLTEAFDPAWDGAIPYSALIGPDGRQLYGAAGLADMVQLRRRILATFPDGDFIGQNAYWNDSARP